MYITGAKAAQNDILTSAVAKLADEPFHTTVPRTTMAARARTLSDVRTIAVAELPRSEYTLSPVRITTTPHATACGFHETFSRVLRWVANVSVSAAAAKGLIRIM